MQDSSTFPEQQDSNTFPEPLMQRWAPLHFADGGVAACAGGILRLVGEEAHCLVTLVTVSTTQDSMVVAKADGSEVGKLVVKHDVVPLITHISCEQYARRRGVASHLLIAGLQHLDAEKVDIAFQESQTDLKEFLLAHGFTGEYFPGRNVMSCNILRPTELEITWNETRLFDSAKQLFVDAFSAAYRRCSEDILGLQNTTKENWLVTTIKDEERLQKKDPDRYLWVIASDPGRKHVLGLAIVELRAASCCCYVRQMAIKEEYQGRGVSKCLVNAIYDRFSKKGVVEFQAMTRKINKKSQRFMEKLGFNICDMKEEGFGEKYVGLRAVHEAPRLLSSPTSSSREPKHRAFPKPSSVQEYESGHLQRMNFAWNAGPLWKEAVDLLIAAFLQAYSSLSQHDLNLPVSKKDWLEEVATRELKMKTDDPDRYQWLTTSAGGSVIGLLIVDAGASAEPTVVTIRQLVVDPKFQRQRFGLPQELGFRLLERYPMVSRIKTYTRRKNLAAQYLLRKFGFHPIPADNFEFPDQDYLTYFRDLSVPAQGKKATAI